MSENTVLNLLLFGAIGAFILLCWVMPDVVLLTTLFCTPFILISVLFLWASTSVILFMEYFAQLLEEYPKGALYAGPIRIDDINDAFHYGFTMDHTVRKIEDHGTFITLYVGKQYMVFWKDEGSCGGLGPKSE